MKNQVTTITQKIIISAPPEKVYEAFVDPDKHSEFTGSKATGKPKIGGKFTAWDGYSFGKFLELEKGKRLVQEWQTTDWPEGYGPSRFELTFNAVAEGTEITMVQSDVPAEQEDELADGWQEFYWKPLKAYFKKPKPPKATAKKP
jgi:activator of HSP90 ATPase